jgi:hypothetical protein
LLRDDLRLRVGWDRVRVFLNVAGWDGDGRVPFSSLGKAEAFEKVRKHGFVHATDGAFGVFEFVRNDLCPLFLVT